MRFHQLIKAFKMMSWQMFQSASYYYVRASLYEFLSFEPLMLMFVHSLHIVSSEKREVRNNFISSVVAAPSFSRWSRYRPSINDIVNYTHFRLSLSLTLSLVADYLQIFLFAFLLSGITSKKWRNVEQHLAEWNDWEGLPLWIIGCLFLGKGGEEVGNKYMSSFRSLSPEQLLTSTSCARSHYILHWKWIEKTLL